jgi:hypothetical protein
MNRQLAISLHSFGLYWPVTEQPAIRGWIILLFNQIPEGFVDFAGIGDCNHPRFLRLIPIGVSGAGDRSRANQEREL